MVESYGRVGPGETREMSAILDPVLRAGEQKLAAAGSPRRPATSPRPPFGGGSWLAHASFQSGLWINSQQRYRS